MEKEGLKKIPEQKNFEINILTISYDFSSLIDRIPYFGGVVLENGKTVKMMHNYQKEFEDELTLKVYLLGLNYALQTNKNIRKTFFPESLEEEIKKGITEFVKEGVISFLNRLSDKENPYRLEDSKKSTEPLADLDKYSEKLFQDYFMPYEESSFGIINGLNERAEKEHQYERKIKPINARFPSLKHVK